MNRLHKITTALTALLLLFTGSAASPSMYREAPLTAYAEETAESYTTGTYESLTYQKYSDHIVISDCKTSVVEVIIPPSIDGLPVTVIGEKAFQYCEKLTKATIPDSVTSIAKSAFSNCSALQSIVIPDTVTSLGSSAFNYCSSLESITLSANLTAIQPWTFRYCEKLTAIALPDGLEIIDEGAFHSSGLTSIAFPDSLTTIGYCAFVSTQLTEIHISEYVTTIGEAAFNSDELTVVHVDANNPNYCSVDGVLFNKDKTELIRFPSRSRITEYVIPDTVKILGPTAFLQCYDLTSVTIPEGVTTIGHGAFNGCNGLTSLTFPDSVTTFVETSTCCMSENLTSVTLPAGLTTLPEHSFSSCNIDAIILPDGMTTLEPYALAYTPMTAIVIPSTVTAIGTSALDCDLLTDIYYSGTEEEWNAMTVGATNTGLESATIHYNFTLKKGDVNLDGNVSIVDVIYLNKALMGAESINTIQRTVSDCDDSADPSASDSLLILKSLVKLVTLN